MQYKKLYKEFTKLGHKNSCALVSATLLTNRSTDCVVTAAELAGKRRNSGMNMSKIVKMYDILDHNMTEIPFSGKTAMTVEPSADNCLIDVRGHVAAYKNGQIDDWISGRKHRVLSVFKVVSTFQSARKFFNEKQEETKC